MNWEPIIITMGCRLNAYESSIIQSIAKTLNMNDFIFINTCTITNESERQCRQEIRKIKKQYPDKKIIVTGCASQLHKDFFCNMPEVEFVISNYHKNNKLMYNKIVNFYKNDNQMKKEDIQAELLTDNAKFYDSEIDLEIYDFNQKSRAFIGIQNGCNHYCSFCIVPFTRGKMSSDSIEKIINSVNKFIENGYNEIVLTGVDITDYGTDLYGKRSLGKLCNEILNKTTLKRLRLSSIDVAEFDEDLYDLFKNNNRMMPYFHISLQSGNDEILKKMRRRHRQKDLLNFRDKILQIRENTTFGADIITGFGNETKEQFMDSIFIAESMPIAFMHAFSYSKKEKTLAYSWADEISKEEKKRRTNVLIEIGKKNIQNLQKKMLGSKFECIIEKGGYAKADNFANINILNMDKYSAKKYGEIAQIKAEKIENEELFGIVE